MAKILMTGGTGLIGKALCKKLIENGHQVSVLTRTIKKSDSINYFLWDVEKSNIDVVLVSYKDTFEGSVRNNEYLPLSGLSRVLIHKNGKAYFQCNKVYYHYNVFCNFSQKENKWKIEKIIKE